MLQRLAIADVLRHAFGGTASRWFDRYGVHAVLFGRVVSTVRTPISVPAGLARMNLVTFIAWSTLGTFVWTALLTAAGYVLDRQYELVAGWVDPVSKVVVGLIVAIYLYRVATFRRRSETSRT